MQIPRMVRDKPGAWEPSVCLDFGQRFLAFLKTVVQKEDTEPRSESHETIPKVWRVKFVPRAGVSVALLDEKGVSEVTAGESRYGFLPNWFWDQLQRDVTTRAQSVESDPVIPDMRNGAAAVLPPGWMI